MKNWLALSAFILLAACGSEPAVQVPSQSVVELSDAFTSDFTLVDENGATVSNDDFKGKVMAVYFGFTTCPDVCPLALGTLSAALNELSDKERAAVAPIFITVDPARDTPQAMKDYLAFDDRIIGLTGTPAAAAKARKSFKVYARQQALPESALGYTMDHTSLFYIVDRDGQPLYALQDTLNAAQIAEMLRRNI